MATEVLSDHMEMLVKSGFKAVATTALWPDHRITGDEYTSEASFVGKPPNAAITLREAARISVFVSQRANVGARARFICSRDTMIRLAAEGDLSRIGIVIPEDTPLHFNELDKHGFPELIKAGTREYNAAKHEVAFLVWPDWPKKPWAACAILTKRLVN